MKILLTGHKGFIGSNMYKNLSKNHKVDTFEWGDEYPSVKKYDWVIHLGAISSTTETNVEKIMKQNYDFSVELYKDCRHYQTNFQFASSASVYGLGDNFKEDAPVDPRTPYAWSKYMFERYVQDHKSKGITQIFRYFNVYGPGEDHKGTQASPYHQFTKQAQETGIIKVFENSEEYKRDFVPVNYLIDYHKMFMETKKSGVFNIGTGVATSFMEVAKEIAYEYSAKIVEIPMPENLKNSYQKYTCANVLKTFKTVNGLEL
jgi:ADP-L-glycero-D-manno-heptose 6-epimerase